MMRRKRGYSQRSLRPSLYRASRQPSEPFHVTVFKVGSTIFALCVVIYVVSSNLSMPKRDGVPYREHLVVKHTDKREEAKQDKKLTVLPTFTSSEKSKHDAFGIAEKHLSDPVKSDTPMYIKQFLDAAKKLRTQFADRYGGEGSVRALLERSVAVLKKDDNDSSRSNAMAFRIHMARQNSGVLNMAFGGSSAVAGYGNFHDQSFPFVAAILLDAMELLGLTLEVRNGAVEHTAVFPYTWCRSNFLGDNLDVSSMDFGTISPQQLEAVIRNMVGSQQEKVPILVFRDSLKANERISLIQSYVNAGILVEPVIIDLQAAFAPFANVKEELLPPGFQGWKEFGAPPGAPGKIRQNMTLKQHELYGWLLSIHVLAGAQSVVHSMLVGSDLIASSTSVTLPKPMLTGKKMETWTPLLYGTPNDDSYNEWSMSLFECRTAFEPVVSGGLGDIIIGGTYGDEVDILHPKGPMYLSQGWVLDLERDERREKQLMKQWDGLAFQDYNKAYFGVAASGPLSIFLPTDDTASAQQSARDAFKHLIVCGSNAKGDACNLERDVTITVGGGEASLQWIVNDAVSYHGKRLCVLVDIPEDAELMSEQDARQAAVDRMQAKQQQTTRRRTLEANVRPGLAIEIIVANSRITWHKGACSIAHIIWEPS